MTATAAPHRPDQLERLREAMSAPTGRVVLVHVPMGNFLMIDGRGGATSPALREAVHALADLSMAVRLYLQGSTGDLLHPMPIEILWRPGDDAAWREAVADEWSWTAMVAQPSAVTPELLGAVRDRVPAERRRQAMSGVHLGSVREGLCAQTGFHGRLESARDVLARLLDHVRTLGYEPHGAHHEIHLVDLRHDELAPLQTVVRQPIHRAA